ncbi:MAG: DUF1501 domain-containing protein, partial [Planctomycetota bacterium]|nr:DUF1501 domain-containing protein [Planctomycetota bacterium]
MLSIQGAAQSACDRLNRRRFIQIGTLGAAGLSLADLLKAEDASGKKRQHHSKRSVILIWQHGGPS